MGEKGKPNPRLIDRNDAPHHRSPQSCEEKDTAGGCYRSLYEETKLRGVEEIRTVDEKQSDREGCAEQK